MRPRLKLDHLNFRHDLIHGCSHQLMHLDGILSLHEVRTIPVAQKQMGELFIWKPRKNVGAGDLIPI